MPKPTKVHAAAAARERGESRFSWACRHHGESEHYSSSGKCVTCVSTADAAKIERRRADPVCRDAYNEGQRVWRQKRMEDSSYREATRAYFRNLHATDASRRGKTRERNAARNWRDATKGGNMTGWYVLEREALQQKYGACRPGFEIDHGVPKVAEDSEGKHIASGLHSMANTFETPQKVNSLKRCQFDPDGNRLQRPANRFPNGAFDPAPTAHEWALISMAEELGTPVDSSLAALRGSLDAKAREHEWHVSTVLSKLPDVAT